MKANQKFVSADEAVSPVIGVILMVAITVVLAAVVFVLVSDLGGDTDSAPTVSLKTDETKDRFSVVKAPSDAEWKDFTWRLSTTHTDHLLCYALDTDADGVEAGATFVDSCVEDDEIDGQAGLLTATAQDFDSDSDGAGGNTALTLANQAMDGGDFVDFCFASSVADGNAAIQSDVKIVITHTASNQVVYTATFASIGTCATSS